MAIFDFEPIIYALDVTAFEDKAVFEKIYNTLSAERKKKIDCLKQENDKRLSLGAGILLKFALKKAGIENFDIVKGENGKPYLKNSKIYFNLSHSKKMAVCIVAPFEVGCDIEKIDKANIKIAKNFFDENEYKDIITSDDKNDKFYRYWTLKESFIKAVGCGFKIPLKDFRISIEDRITVSKKGQNTDYRFFETDKIKGYRLSVCGLGDLSNAKIQKIPIKKLLIFLQQ
ncbi:MAG: 4'-phosphopantetheinyl transferase superfamily protein [Clostridia bacterium]|nr:4'-phosphopantetheinyl transferase superfamily protein [Clostridia bacterium]